MSSARLTLYYVLILHLYIWIGASSMNSIQHPLMYFVTFWLWCATRRWGALWLMRDSMLRSLAIRSDGVSIACILRFWPSGGLPMRLIIHGYKISTYDYEDIGLVQSISLSMHSKVQRRRIHSVGRGRVVESVNSTHWGHKRDFLRLEKYANTVVLLISRLSIWSENGVARCIVQRLSIPDMK